MELTLCGLAVVLFALWVEFELAVKTVGKMIRNRRCNGKGAAANRTANQTAFITSLPICLDSLPRYQKTA